MRHAIVRPPGDRFAEGLTTVDLGKPDLELALEQHAAYCRALERCGLTLTRLPADPRHPDSTFVEDTAVLTPRRAILARPGAPSRAGEVDAIRETVASFFPECAAIRAPGTLDAGDVCETDDGFLIGISRRTNEAGARQLAGFLSEEGFASRFVDIRGLEEILHLKSGVAYPGGGRIVTIEALRSHPSLREFEIIPVAPEESYAANCIRVNDRVLMAAGHPRFEAALGALGYDPLPVAMSEFQKTDGGLSCLSLRF